MSCDSDCVTLSDDDDPGEITQIYTHNISCKRKETEDITEKNEICETILIDDDISQQNNLNNNTELPHKSRTRIKNTPLRPLDKTAQDDDLFSDFIEKCLDLENSEVMLRIMNKTVMRVYEESDKAYRQSPEFKRVLLEALNRLETDPNHKFSHVKALVGTLKLHKMKREDLVEVKTLKLNKKKRVQLTTLATNLNGNGVSKSISNGNSKESKMCSIVLDSDDEQKDTPTINLDDNDIIDLDEENGDEEKENHAEESINIQNSQEIFLEPHSEVPFDLNFSSHESGIPVSAITVQVEFESSQPPNPNQKKIEQLEREIAYAKGQIEYFDQLEVVDDSCVSPYIMCENFKARIVKLYAQLCTLTGEQPVKRRSVRLQVMEGHPPGPVKRLETFINENIGANGAPLFPDFCDVVKCVVVANIEDSLGWSKQQVMAEANALFTQCGRALQRQRQRREYRDLISRLKTEQPEYDPADEDPELMRKLEENRRIAVMKENDLLERYTKLQNQPQKQKPAPSLESPITINYVQNQDIETQIISDDDEPQSTLVSDNSAYTTVIRDDSTHTTVISDTIEAITMVTDDNSDDPENILVDEEINKNNSELMENWPCEVISDEDSNFEPPEVKFPQEIVVKEELTEKTDVNTETDKVGVKQEPVDIVKMLEELGDNYSMSIIDIEDPTLVIEISSDESSDEEMDCA